MPSSSVVIALSNDSVTFKTLLDFVHAYFFELDAKGITLK